MQSFLTPQRLMSLIVVLLVVSSFLSQSIAGKVARPFLAVVETLATPVRAPLHQLAAAVRPDEPRDLGLDAFTNVGHYTRKITALEMRVKELTEEVRQLRRVREVLGEAVSIVMLEAGVTGVTGPKSSPVLRIDHGSNSGVVSGRVVVSGFHLVGEVSEAEPKTALVRTINREKNKLQVRMIQQTPEEVTLRSGSVITVEWSVDEHAFVQQVGLATDVEKGDFALLADDGFVREAQGFFIGQVTSVDKDPQDPLNYKKIIVRPTFKHENLRRVTVLLPSEE